MEVIPLPVLEGDRQTPCQSPPIMDGREELLKERLLQLEWVRPWD